MISLPLLPFKVSAPAPPVTVKPLPDAINPKSIVAPPLAAVKLPLFSSELLIDALVAVNAVIPVALAVHPAVILRMSPSDKSVIASIPLLTLNVSFPDPPVMMSSPVPPVMISLPPSPLMVSLAPSPLRVSFPDPPVIIS